MLRSFVVLGLFAFSIACSGSSSSPGDDSSDNGHNDGRTDGGLRFDGGRSNVDGGSALDGSAGNSDGGTDNALNGVTNHLTFSGDCSPDMENLDVVTNTSSYDSLAVVNGSAPLSGGLQVAVNNGQSGVVVLSTRERVGPPDNALVINVTSGGVEFTNLCNTSAGGCTYDSENNAYDGDPIAGEFGINSYDPVNGVLDVSFDGVVLQSTQSTALCTVNGTVTTKHLYP